MKSYKAKRSNNNRAKPTNTIVIMETLGEPVKHKIVDILTGSNSGVNFLRLFQS